jgi:serpin B
MSPFRFGSLLGARSPDPQPLAAGNTAFALDLYSHFRTVPSNLFFSPFSLSTCLAMTYAGARGDTAIQMARVLHFDLSSQELHSAFGQLRRQLAAAGGRSGLALHIANALWAQKGHPFLPALQQTAATEYDAAVHQADFQTQAAAAIEEINRWVAQRTSDRIRQVLPPGSLNEITFLVLVNAIYFKGAWAKPFDKTDTSLQPFHLAGNRPCDGPLMHHFDHIRYMDNAQFQAVELPYRNYGFSMVILLPRKTDGCGELEQRLTPELLANALSQMKPQEVEIFLPRFKLQSSLRLDTALAAMGMPDAFKPAKADFSGIDGTRSLFISGIFHQAVGDVNEEGTEAAAATAVAMMALCIEEPPPPPPIFRADHPFIFFIRDTQSGSLLFIGRLADPSEPSF